MKNVKNRPDIRGSYSLIVRFAGSESYFGSSASTYFYASEAPTPQPTTITQTTTMTMGRPIALPGC